ncbi:MAG: M28 family metallopeptidase [Balneolaceae bacterium]
MRSNVTILFFSVLFLVQCNSFQNNQNTLLLEKLDPKIQEMLNDVSADSIEKNVYQLADFGTRHTLSETENDSIGIGAARRWIKSEMDKYSENSGGRLEVEFHSYMQEPGGRVADSTEVVNVVATLPGTDPNDDRIFVVSGHYDSRVTDIMDYESAAPGANDDASGTAAVMEMARVMSHFEFPATLVFMAVAGEEQGLLGASKWAEDANEADKNIAGMFTNDIIGNHAAEDGELSDPYKVRLFAEGVPPQRELDSNTLRYLQTGAESDMPTRQMARTIKEVSESYVPDMNVWLIYRLDRYLRGGDHRPFIRLGYPAVRFSEPNEEYKHQHEDVRMENGEQYGDLPELVDYPYISRVTKVNMAAMANLARSPQPPINVGMNVSNLENSTRLRWEASPSQNLAGYEVLWRETTSPVWQHKEFIGNSTHYTADLISKDNWIFGVRSVSEDGHVGVPVYPMPFRD